MNDLLDTIFDFSDIYDRYGIKGCALFILGIAAFIGIIIVLAWALG